MVIVEFFSQSPIENMVSTLANRPEVVVFVGDLKKMKRYHPVFLKFLEATGNAATRLEYRGIRSRNLQEIVESLEEIVEEFPGCHFDITGGDPMSTAAVGIVCERHRDQGIELHQYNIRTGKVYDCDLNGKTASGDIPGMSVEQNIILHGGCVVSGEVRENGTLPWDFTEEFLKDVETMWKICRTNVNQWNRQITMIDDMGRFDRSDDPLWVRVRTAELESYLSERRVPMDLKGVLEKLERAGMLRGLEREGEYFSLGFKNDQVRRVLTKAGTILELVTCLAAKKAAQKDGKLCYHDAMTGVFIDWDGVVHEQDDQTVDTENEIDVILMRGLVPVFISCKNGAVGEDELYKLATVAERFGGDYVKKVLVGTTLGRGGRSKQYLLARAKDMGIQVLEGVHKMPEAEFVKQLRLLA